MNNKKSVSAFFTESETEDKRNKIKKIVAKFKN